MRSSRKRLFASDRSFPQNAGVKLRFLWLIAAFCLACALPARALINIEMPVPKIFEESKAVIVGTVTAVNADNRVIDLKTTNMAKGEPAIETFRVQIAAPADLIKSVKPDQPLVMFTAEVDGRPVALIHLADKWLMAEALPKASPPAWRVTQAHTGRLKFTGTTAELAKIVGELKGK
jgi:hypothetical protein